MFEVAPASPRTDSPGTMESESPPAHTRSGCAGVNTGRLAIAAGAPRPDEVRVVRAGGSEMVVTMASSPLRPSASLMALRGRSV